MCLMYVVMYSRGQALLLLCTHEDRDFCCYVLTRTGTFVVMYSRGQELLLLCTHEDRDF